MNLLHLESEVQFPINPIYLRVNYVAAKQISECGLIESWTSRYRRKLQRMVKYIFWHLIPPLTTCRGFRYVFSSTVKHAGLIFGSYCTYNLPRNYLSPILADFERTHISMSKRQPSDAFTRFTSNSIHAAQKPSRYTTPPGKSPSMTSSAPSAATASSTSNAPPNETPAAKVARLRAQLRAQREGGAQLSFTDRVIVRGRRFADGAHRFTAVLLLGLTGVSAVVAVYGMTSLVTHSRRQKKAFIDSELDRLREAQQAFLRGEADAEQLHLLEQERAGEEMADKWKREKDQQKTRGLWARAKGVFGDTSRDMGTETALEAERRKQIESGGRILEEAWTQPQQDQIPKAKDEFRPVAVRESEVAGVGYDAKGRPVPINKMERLPSNIKIERRTGEQAGEQFGAQQLAFKGGSLDQLADNAVSAATPKGSGGWYSSWFGGKS